MPRKLRIVYPGATYESSAAGTTGKTCSFKEAAAKRLRKETTAGNPWIARRLRMGSPNYVSNLIQA